MGFAAQGFVLVVAEAREDGLALRRGDGAALGDDGGVGDRFGKVGEQRFHVGGGLEPGFGRAGLAVGIVDIGRGGDAQHGVVRGVEIGLGVASGVGRDERQVERISEVDQARLGGLLGRVAAARQLDVQAIGEQRVELVGIGPRLVVLAIGEQAGERPLPARGQRDQPVGLPGERVERDMRFLVDRAVEVRGGHQAAQIVVAGLVLREQREPVDRAGGADRRRGARPRASRR